MNPVRADHKVLVIATDPMLAALVGALVELTQLRAAFLEPDERPEDALARVKPLVAILVDAQTDDAASDLFLARARRRGIRVLMFGPVAAVARREAWARRTGVPVFRLPEGVAALQAALDVLLREKGLFRRGERRTRAQRDPASVATVDDGTGTRWTVYDRRSADRRRSVIDRRFVSDRGEVRQCDVALDEADALSVATLTEQLARAVLIE
jgi:hypothetical protein